MNELTEQDDASRRVRPHSIGYAIVELHRIPREAGEGTRFKVETILRTGKGHDWKNETYTTSFGDVALDIAVGVLKHYVLDMLARADDEARAEEPA